MLVVMSAGFMMTTSHQVSGGSDLRPTRNEDLSDLVKARSKDNLELSRRTAVLRSQIDQLSQDDEGRSNDLAYRQATNQAALTPVKGPGVEVVLTDAPLAVKPAGIDEDLLVVHQQDIQMVVNVLWSGGAEAMTIQGQRVTSLTGIKCVGNTVVLRGVPYAPPYRIAALGDPQRLGKALAASRDVAIYKQYVTAYRLGWKQRTFTTMTMPGYEGAMELTHATAGPG